VLAGDAGDDTIIGGTGNDAIAAGPGNDVIDDGEGDDIVDAGAGDDTIRASAGDDDIDGGEGHDTLDYSGFTTDIYVDLSQGTAWSGQSGLDLIASIEEVIAGAGDDTILVGATGTILTGGGGNDLFIFTVTEDDASLSQALVHEILDFVVGDRIRVAEYDIAQLAERSAEERFEALYDELEQGLDADLPIRVRYERYDDMDHTIIEADLDRNDVYEISINVHGLLLPTISDHTA
jgi:Ca2+-binding RTX toxin-like protein